MPARAADQERAKRMLETERLADREALRSTLRTMGECWFWCILGVACVGWSLHSSSEAAGRVAFWGGLTIGNGGMLVALFGHYHRAESRGDY